MRVNTARTMPLDTMLAGGPLRALRSPDLVARLDLSVLLWPLVWAMNRKSDLDGSAHKIIGWTAFSGRDRVDHLTMLPRNEGGWLVGGGAFSPACARRRASAPDRRSTQPLGE